MKKKEPTFFEKEQTPYDDPSGIRTRVTAVKGRCLNRLTNGPKKWWRQRESNPRPFGYEPSALAN